jgi:hypothetical protein
MSVTQRHAAPPRAARQITAAQKEMRPLSAPERSAILGRNASA